MKDADFPTRQIRAEITGEVEVNSDKETAQIADLVLNVTEVDQSFLLVEGLAATTSTSPPAAKVEPLPDRLAELRTLVADGTTRLTVTGEVKEREGPPLGLTVETFEILPAKSDL